MTTCTCIFLHIINTWLVCLLMTAAQYARTAHLATSGAENWIFQCSQSRFDRKKSTLKPRKWSPGFSPLALWPTEWFKEPQFVWEELWYFPFKQPDFWRALHRAHQDIMAGSELWNESSTMWLVAKLFWTLDITESVSKIAGWLNQQD